MNQEKSPNCLSSGQSLDIYCDFRLLRVQLIDDDMGEGQRLTRIVDGYAEGDFFSVYGRHPDGTWDAVHDFLQGVTGFALLDELAEFEARWEVEIDLVDASRDSSGNLVVLSAVIVGPVCVFGIIDNFEVILLSEEIKAKFEKLLAVPMSPIKAFSRTNFACKTEPELKNAGVIARKLLPGEAAEFLRTEVLPGGGMAMPFCVG